MSPKVSPQNKPLLVISWLSLEQNKGHSRAPLILAPSRAVPNVSNAALMCKIPEWEGLSESGLVLSQPDQDQVQVPSRTPNGRRGRCAHTTRTNSLLHGSVPFYNHQTRANLELCNVFTTLLLSSGVPYHHSGAHHLTPYTIRHNLLTACP